MTARLRDLLAGSIPKKDGSPVLAAPCLLGGLGVLHRTFIPTDGDGAHYRPYAFVLAWGSFSIAGVMLEEPEDEQQKFANLEEIRRRIREEIEASRALRAVAEELVSEGKERMRSQEQ